MGLIGLKITKKGFSGEKVLKISDKLLRQD